MLRYYEDKHADENGDSVTGRQRWVEYNTLNKSKFNGSQIPPEWSVSPFLAADGEQAFMDALHCRYACPRPAATGTGAQIQDRAQHKPHWNVKSLLTCQLYEECRIR